MLELRRKRLLSSAYVVEEEGKPVADLVRSRWRGRARLTTRGESFGMSKRGFLRLTYTLRQGETDLLQAQEANLLGSRLLFTYGSRHFQIHREAWFSSTLVVEADGSEIGNIKRRDFLAGGARIQLPDNLPLEVRAFLGWIAVVQWERRRAARAG